MPEDGDADEFRDQTGSLQVVDRWEGGVGWIAHPEELMERASHALAVDGDVWVVDPVDAPGVDAVLDPLGDVVGVVIGLDRHTRDAAAVARRHDVPIYVPESMVGVADEFDTPVERFDRRLPGTDVRTVPIRNSSVPPWQEVGLYRESEGTLVVPESVGTASYYRVGPERLGVHPMLRPVPPRRVLARYSPERVLVGHGTGVLDDAAEALADALAGSRRRMPALYVKALKLFVS